QNPFDSISRPPHHHRLISLRGTDAETFNVDHWTTTGFNSDCQPQCSRVAALKKRGAEFIGTLYAGVMLTEEGPKTLEFNVRFGDPECQPLMSRLKSDLGEVLLKAANRELDGVKLDWDKRMALCVVVSSDGYPGSFKKGQVIGGLDDVEAAGATVFHAGTAEKDGKIINSGGRVLGVTALGSTVSESQDVVYEALEKLDWPGGFYRKDIGYRAVARES
ncbi:phosphoribosylamine--glycine ligase, partial [Pseudomonadota bacterium]